MLGRHMWQVGRGVQRPRGTTCAAPVVHVSRLVTGCPAQQGCLQAVHADEVVRHTWLACTLEGPGSSIPEEEAAAAGCCAWAATSS